MNNQTDHTEEMEIDLLHLAKVLWKKVWVIIISIVLCGALTLSYAVFLITPEYKSSAMMYVNNSSISLASTSISLTDLNAAKSLLEVYVIILSSRTTLEAVIETAQLDYTYEELSKMVKADAVNNTEVFEVVATSDDPAEAKLIVDTITEILPDRIANILDGSSVRVVDRAVRSDIRTSPSYTKYTAIGMVLGAVLSCAVIILIDLLNTTVRNEEYLLERYDLPILSVIPDMTNKKSHAYGYYKEYYKQEQDENSGSQQ